LFPFDGAEVIFCCSVAYLIVVGIGTLHIECDKFANVSSQPYVIQVIFLLC